MHVIERKVQTLLQAMTLAEKIGQMTQLNAEVGVADSAIKQRVRDGMLGSVLNLVDGPRATELQRIALHESRLGIPLLIGRDVIHGFQTVMPIPLGQAATWNADLVRAGARCAAEEAAQCGVNWTFAPMIDIARDPRWGRIAESLGEDPVLASVLGAAMVAGFQGDDPAVPGSIAACAKHFVGYGEAESGRDYATTNVPENELRNVHLQPFHAAVQAGVLSLMTSFSDIDGVPATANRKLLDDILRKEWGFDGLVVSDWDSIRQLAVHGLTDGDRGSAFEAATAGVDMEMQGDAYFNHLHALVEDGVVAESVIDRAAGNILRVKMRLGLFERAADTLPKSSASVSQHALDVARQSALQSLVLLKNDNGCLPLSAESLTSLAVIGPLADDAYEQLGTWIFDGDPARSMTPLAAMQALVGDAVAIHACRGLRDTRSGDQSGFEAALETASICDATVLFLGEESILSGEAHSRADITLPGAQADLIHRLQALGKPLVVVILAGRPLALSNIVDDVDGLLYAWHPGSMGGPAIADVLFGVESPSGKLPVSFPRVLGQVPIYYNHKHGGKPPTPETWVHMDDFPARAPQTSLGMTAFHMDVHYTPLFPFGHGLSYAKFVYSDLQIEPNAPTMDDAISISVSLQNNGEVTADEVAQLYVRDLVGNVTRPVRELKTWQRMQLEPGESRRVHFKLSIDDLSFCGRELRRIVEPGEFHVWVGGSSTASLHGEFRLREAPTEKT